MLQLTLPALAVRPLLPLPRPTYPMLQLLLSPPRALPALLLRPYHLHCQRRCQCRYFLVCRQVRVRNLRKHSPGFEPSIRNWEEDGVKSGRLGVLFFAKAYVAGLGFQGFIILLRRRDGDRMSVLFIVCFFFLCSSRCWHEP